MSGLNNLKFVLLLASAGLPCAIVSAQGVATADAKDDVQEIIVTAQRRAEGSVSVPIALVAVSGEQLQKAGIQDVASLQQVVPGLTLGFAGANAQPTIRGVGTQVAGAGLPSNVATYVDDVYRPNQVTTNVNFADISSVTVLKGPQGALYGRNATGGAILINTNAPSFDSSAIARLSYGRFDDKMADIFVTGGITDTLAASLSVFRRDSDGYTKNVATGETVGGAKITTLRTKLLFKPSDSAKFTLTYEHNNTRDDNAFLFGNYKGQSVGTLFPGVLVTSKPRTTSTDFPAIFRSNSNGVNFKAEFDLGNASLTSITSGEWQKDYRQFDADGSTASIQHIVFPARETTYTNETYLTSQSDGPLQWTAGVSLYQDKSRALPLTVVSLSPPLVAAFGRTVDDSVAVYGDVTYKIVDRLYLTGSLRYATDKVRAHVFAFPDYADQVGDEKFHALTPRAVLRFEIAPRTSVYASYNQGYKTGGFNVFGGNTVPVRPEKIKAYEVGFKTARSAFRLEGSAYYYDYTNLQVSAFLGNASTLLNAASARIYGAESLLSADLTSRFQVSVGASYVDAKYRDFPGAPHYQFSPTAGIVIFPDDASGKQIPNSPKFSSSLSANYTLPVAGGELGLNSTYAYRSTTLYDPFGETRQRAYGVLDLRAQWTTGNGFWAVGVFAKNATNRDYVRTIAVGATSFGTQYAPPRVVGLDLTFRGPIFPHSGS